MTQNFEKIEESHRRLLKIGFGVSKIDYGFKTRNVQGVSISWIFKKKLDFKKI